MKPTHLLRILIIPIAVLAYSFPHCVSAKIYYVNIVANGSGDGSSWTNAYTDVQDAIDISQSGDSICVATGEYLPTHLRYNDSPRSLTFYINKAISLFGGFTGTPGSEGNFSDRNPKLNRTLLSGDTGLLGDHADDVFHVVYIDHVSDSMLLDGFAIAFGNGTGASGLDAYGAGIYNDATGGRSNPRISNCDICINTTFESGGGMMNYAGEGGVAQPVLTNCIINENTAGGGGGIANLAENGGVASPVLINCKIIGNEALTAQGGAVSCVAHSGHSSPVMINCIVTGNDSPSSAAFMSFVTGTGDSSPEFINCAFSGNTGGSIRVLDQGVQTSLITIRNSILWENTGGSGLTMNGANADVSFSIIQFGLPGEGNLTEDPLFVIQPALDGAHPDGDLHLHDNSPAIDAGSNPHVQAIIEEDADNLPRFVNPLNGLQGTVDIGPYEVQSIITSSHTIHPDLSWDVYPAIAKNTITINADAKNKGKLYIYDMNGKLISNRDLETGKNIYTVDVSQLPAGLYVVHIQIDGIYDARMIAIQ